MNKFFNSFLRTIGGTLYAFIVGFILTFLACMAFPRWVHFNLMDFVWLLIGCSSIGLIVIGPLFLSEIGRLIAKSSMTSKVFMTLVLAFCGIRTLQIPFVLPFPSSVSGWVLTIIFELIVLAVYLSTIINLYNTD